ncbi:phage tail-like protein [Sphingomonas zeicaulis]|uniref:phage tail protein n=1 Tax=Sphingomonas zeicaulis TaxID=1632740 RepID=UPI003D1B8E8E
MASRFLVSIDGLDEDAGFSAVTLPPLPAVAAERGTAEGRVVLRRPASGDARLIDWWQAERAKPGSGRRDVAITLLDGAGRPALRWRVKGARPVLLSHGALDAESNAVLSETVELAFEGIEIEVG